MTTPSRRRFLARAAQGVAAAASLGAGLSCAPRIDVSSPGSATAPAPRRRSFSFLHTYESSGRYWQALDKADLVRPGTGVRLVHSAPWGEDAQRFNAVARIDGPLHRMISERRCPFIIDRVAGGLPFAPYTFDQSLLDAYARLLGDDFLGGQVHEVLSNTHNDWDRLTRAAKGDEAAVIRPDAIRAFFTALSAQDQLEYGTLDNYAGRVRPRTAEQWWAECERGARRQIDRVGGLFSYCEGSDHAWPAWSSFFRLGARYGLAEQGVWASPQGQLSIASLRGAAKAAGRPWGVFFAPWGPNGCTAFIPPEEWAWRAPPAFFKDTGWPVGPAFGSSTAMQRRLFFHTYLSGASTLHEEWGSETNFTDVGAARLSSSGQVVRELLDFQAAHPDVGEPYTPLALALHAPNAQADGAAWNPVRAALFRGGPADEAIAKLNDAGNAEANCYAPCSVPEVFDVIPSDAPEEALRTYERVIPIDASANCAAEVIRLANELAPVARESHLPMQINRRASDGAWIFALHNPWGAARGDIDNVGSVLNERCAQQDTLRPKVAFKRARAIYAWPRSSSLDVAGDDTLHVNVGPGGTLILELTV